MCERSPTPTGRQRNHALMGDADPLATCSVLYVEDDADVREQLARFMGRRVATLYTAQDGAEGLALWQRWRPDVVVTDLMMPVMDGLQMATAIRAQEPSVPIVVTTAFNDQDFFLKAIDLGVDKYVIKPIDTDVLLRAVRRGAEMAKAQLAARLAASVFEASSNAILVTDRERRIVAVNRAFCEMTGYGEAEVLGQTPALLNSGRQDAEFYRTMWQRLDGVGSWCGEIWNRRKDGEIYAGWMTIDALKAANGRTTHYVAVFADITERKREEEDIRRLAYYDALTELPNRVLFNDRLDQAIRHAKRSDGRLAVMFLDLDRFKQVNDTMGHAVGDLLLHEVAVRLGASVRQGDTVSRLGGDEFMVLLPEISSADDAETVAKKLVHAITRPFSLRGEAVGVSASIGITLFPEDGADAALLVKNADAAMYRAKEQGRDNYQFFRRGEA